MTLLSAISWALFGNDEDGPYGFYAHTTLGAIHWWLRNPCHNLTHHVLNWPGGPIYRWGRLADKRTPEWWKRPFVDPWNGYIGWRQTKEGNGVLGIACRQEVK